MSMSTDSETNSQGIRSGVRSPRRHTRYLGPKERTLDLARLRRELNYNPETGIFTWKVARAKAKPGDVAGCVFSAASGHQYITIGTQGSRFFAHRLAVLWMTGAPPQALVDHRDGNGLDNRWGNLREANDSQNNCNRALSKSNKLRIKGVCKVKNRFIAQIRIGGKNTFLGSFITAEQAASAYAAAANKHYGEFARLA